MTPVMQTKTGRPGGDCFRACVASLLELPIESVPDFVNEGGEPDMWHQRFRDWLADMNMGSVCQKISKGMSGFVPGLCILGVRLAGYEKTGPTSNWLHAVVGRSEVTSSGRLKFHVVHDPLPGAPEIVEIVDVLWVVWNAG